jgi:hypothetical protein
MASKLFWLAAIVQLLVSLRFTVLVRVIERAHLTTRVLALASGQRQDSWLAAAVIWTVIVLQDTPYAEALQLCGLGTLAWLIVRAYQRIGDLAHGGRE